MQVLYENHYLSDNDVANYARHSFEKLAENYSDTANEGLIKFLARGMASGDWDKLLTQLVKDTRDEDEAHDSAVYMRNIPEHWVPFGHPQITLRCSAPVPIRTQLFKHKIGFVESEVSRRYVSSAPRLYVPEYFRSKAANVKQGSGDVHPNSGLWQAIYIETCDKAIEQYKHMIFAGICPEQARFILPQGCEVQWVWTGSLYAFANMYNQRSDSHAQKEVQEVAAQIDKIIAPLFPISWAALTKGEY